MQDGAAFLDPAIMPPPNNLTVDDQNRANRNVAFGQTFAGLVDGGLQKLVYCSLSHEAFLVRRDSTQSVPNPVFLLHPRLQGHQRFIPQGLLHRDRTLASGFPDFTVELPVVKACCRCIIASGGVVDAVQP